MATKNALKSTQQILIEGQKVGRGRAREGLFSRVLECSPENIRNAVKIYKVSLLELRY